MISYEDLKKANEAIKTTDIKGNDYAEVNQRIKAFRMVYPQGFIRTQLVDDASGRCIFKAEVGVKTQTINADKELVEELILGVGHAYEKEGSTFINKTSYIENCETSAVGRALGMAGFGIDTSVASAEEVQNAIANQVADERKASPKQIKFLASKYEGENLEKLFKANNITKLEDMSMSKASDLIGKIKGGK